MVKLTAEARRCLSEYLAEVRSSLRHCPSVRVEEVENDVLEHIEHALSGASVDVDVAELREVLKRLGSPSQWVPPEELNGIQRAILAIRSGPEDLRLGYLAFSTFATVLLACAGLNSVVGIGTTLPILVVGIAVSFCLARAALAVVSTPSRVERWLIYPSLIVVYIPITALLVLWPAAAAIVTEAYLRNSGEFPWSRSFHVGTITAFALEIIGCAWWGCLALLACAGREPFVTAIFLWPRSFVPGGTCSSLVAH